ncbi:MAG: 4Fe-4S binding protein [Bacteroidetes bacterium]|nr:4Fe-4S binding protein [Bacteroidota bacterium]
MRIMDPGYFTGQKGIATIEFPHERIPVPETGRYKLHNEMDDCIVCDKCAKICPVNCISIEAIRSAEEFGKTSDGTPKRIYASRFDIDMAKCCFCGLCTTVCPTECLTMTPDYDYSTFNIIDHLVGFGNMSEEDIALKKKEWGEHIAQKTTASAATAVQPKPALHTSFKPKIQPPQGS